MISTDMQFLVFLFSVIIGFTFLILVLLKYRKTVMLKNFLLTSNDAWDSIKKYAISVNLERTHLLYCVYQDHNSTQVKMLLRNNVNEEIGESIKTVGKRKRSMTVFGQKYLLTYLLTWKKEIILQKDNQDLILAKYVEQGWFEKHHIEIPGFGTIKSSRFSFDGNARYTYELNGKIIGIMVRTFNGTAKGRILILPDSIPLDVRLFILSS